MRKAVVGTVVAVVALMLTACGSVGSIASSIIGPCPAMNYGDLVWSSDGLHIGFEASRQGEPSQIVIIDTDGAVVRQHNSRVQSATGLQWLPDSQTLAYTDGISKVYTVAIDGTTSEVTLPTNSIRDLSISPDGKMMAYNIFYSYGSVEAVGLANRDGSVAIRIPYDQISFEAWSPDGSRITYAHWNGRDTHLLTMLMDGSEGRDLAVGLGLVHWSPDGKWLGFIKSNESDLYIVKADGSDEKLVTILSSQEFSWLPDSQHIAYVSRTPDYFLNIIDVNTLTVETFTNIRIYDRPPPSWSPDGTQAVFVSLDHTPQNPYIEDIFIVNRDGTGLKRLTDNPGRYQCLQWPF